MCVLFVRTTVHVIKSSVLSFMKWLIPISLLILNRKSYSTYENTKDIYNKDIIAE